MQAGDFLHEAVGKESAGHNALQREGIEPRNRIESRRSTFYSYGEDHIRTGVKGESVWAPPGS